MERRPGTAFRVNTLYATCLKSAIYLCFFGSYHHRISASALQKLPLLEAVCSTVTTTNTPRCSVFKDIVKAVNTLLLGNHVFAEVVPCVHGRDIDRLGRNTGWKGGGVPSSTLAYNLMSFVSVSFYCVSRLGDILILCLQHWKVIS